MKFNIKKLLKGMMLSSVLLCCCLTCSFSKAASEWPSDVGIEAEGGIVMDLDSGAVLYGQNIHKPYPPASITKLLTALIVIENCKLDEMVSFSEDSVNNVESGSGNKLNVMPGDRLTAEDCLYSLLLHSCNQAANALAEHVAGSREAFVNMMNKKIKEIGCTESHFANPSGLNDEDQYVTAYDMALIARAAFDNPLLLKIDSALYHKVGPTKNNPDGLTIYMEHRLLRTTDQNSRYYYPDAIAGKTGYTSLAGSTLVTYAKREGRRLVSVILKGRPYQYYIDGKNLLEFGFERFHNITAPKNKSWYTTVNNSISLNGKTYQYGDLYLDPLSKVTLPVGIDLSDTQSALVTSLSTDHPDRAVALIRYTYYDRVVGQGYLLVKESALATKKPAATIPPSKTYIAALNSDSPILVSSPSKKNNSGMIIIICIFFITAAGGFVYYRITEKRKRATKWRKERWNRHKHHDDIH